MAGSELRLFKIGFGLYLIYYYLLFIRDFTWVFGPNGQNHIKDIADSGPSLIFLFPHPLTTWVTLILLLFFAVQMISGSISRLGLLGLWLLNISFHNANPMIIHEPQQLTSFLLVGLMFFSKEGECPSDTYLLRTLVYALGFYYLIAAIKKLPDPLWINGEALTYILQWPGLASPSAPSTWLGQSPCLGKVLTYSVLLFEFSVLPLIYFRKNIFLYILIFTFHLGIGVFMEVGTFTPLFWAWALLLLGQKEQTKILSFLFRRS